MLGASSVAGCHLRGGLVLHVVLGSGGGFSSVGVVCTDSCCITMTQEHTLLQYQWIAWASSVRCRWCHIHLILQTSPPATGSYSRTQESNHKESGLEHWHCLIFRWSTNTAHETMRVVVWSKCFGQMAECVVVRGTSSQIWPDCLSLSSECLKTFRWPFLVKVFETYRNLRKLPLTELCRRLCSLDWFPASACFESFFKFFSTRQMMAFGIEAFQPTSEALPKDAGIVSVSSAVQEILR